MTGLPSGAEEFVKPELAQERANRKGLVLMIVFAGVLIGGFVLGRHHKKPWSH